MSQVISNQVFKLIEKNENKVEISAKAIEEKMLKVLNESKLLKVEVGHLQHEHFLIDKQTSCTESVNMKMENEIADLKNKTEEAACLEHRIQWKILKIEILKELETQQNELIDTQKLKYDEIVEEASVASHSSVNVQTLINSQVRNASDSNGLTRLKEKVSELTDKIQKKKSGVLMTDPKLYFDIEMLEKRNSALLIRYQRQLQDTESRHRQTLLELNSLQKIL